MVRTGLIVLVSITAGLTALALFGRLVQIEGADQWEHAAYLHWQGQCSQPSHQLLCTRREQ